MLVSLVEPEGEVCWLYFLSYTYILYIIFSTELHRVTLQKDTDESNVTTDGRFHCRKHSNSHFNHPEWNCSLVWESIGETEIEIEQTSLHSMERKGVEWISSPPTAHRRDSLLLGLRLGSVYVRAFSLYVFFKRQPFVQEESPSRQIKESWSWSWMDWQH